MIHPSPATRPSPGKEPGIRPRAHRAAAWPTPPSTSWASPRPGTAGHGCAAGPAEGEGADLLYIDSSLCITSIQRPGRCLLWLSGELDTTNCAATADILTQAAQQEGHVVIDAGHLAFADTAGARMLSTVATQPGVLVRNVPHRLERLLELLCLPALS